MDNLKHLDKEHKHQITISSATKKDREEWQKEVMPYEKTDTAKNWNWTKGEITAAYMLSKANGQNPEFKVLKKNDIPVAMMLYVNNFKEKTNINFPKETSFIWYVQKAPNQYLLKHGINEKDFDIKISKAILDVALVSALKQNGNVLLHADHAGKDVLMNFYKKEGFTQISKESGKRISLMRPNDGRYFHMPKEKTLEVLNKNRSTIMQSLIKETVHTKYINKVVPKMNKNKNISITEYKDTKITLIEKIKAFNEKTKDKSKETSKEVDLER